MPSQNSIYRKIQLVLEVSKAVKVQSISGLQDAIRTKNFVAFHTRRFDRSKDTFVTAISDKSIHKVVKLCRELQLIGENGNLTDEGREAIQRLKFERVIAERILTYFHQAGVNIRDLNKSIVRNIQSNPPILTTSKVLWDFVEEKTDYSKFARMLNLLSQCGGADSSQKKIYLRINPRT